MLQPSLRPRELFVAKQVGEKADRISQLLVQKTQPVSFLRTHLPKLAAFLQELFLPSRQFARTVFGDGNGSLLCTLSAVNRPSAILDPVRRVLDQAMIPGRTQHLRQMLMGIRCLRIPG